MRKKWTYEKCLKEAKKYNRKIEFLNGNRSCYDFAYRKEWLDKICGHMEVSGDKYNRCIYVYEFSDNSVYVGLTYNIDERHKQHLANRKSNNSKVLKHIKNTGLQPNFKKLTDYINYQEASIKEGEIVEQYKNDGWNILNGNKTGSLGASNLKWTYDECKKIIEKSEHISDVYNTSTRIIVRCYSEKWYDLIELLLSLDRTKQKNGYWSKDKCKEEVKKYKTLKDFFEGSSSAYRKCVKMGWKDVYDHLESKKPKGYWEDKELCREESKKYKNRFSFQKGSRGAYKSAWKNGWLNEFFPD